MGWTPEQLARALNEAADIRPDVVAVIAKAAFNVKREWQANARGSSGAHAPAYPSSITYDIETGLGIGAEVGPDKGRAQGPLGNLLEYGSVNNPPHGDGKRAADSEEPRLEKHLLMAAARKLW